jgi:hypothetical protein
VTRGFLSRWVLVGDEVFRWKASTGKGRSVSHEGVPGVGAIGQARLFGIMCELLGSRGESPSPTKAVLVRGLDRLSRRFDSADLCHRRPAALARSVVAPMRSTLRGPSISVIGVVLQEHLTEIAVSVTHPCVGGNTLASARPVSAVPHISADQTTAPPRRLRDASAYAAV